jgi:hypothetical protein
MAFFFSETIERHSFLSSLAKGVRCLLERHIAISSKKPRSESDKHAKHDGTYNPSY